MKDSKSDLTAVPIDDIWAELMDRYDCVLLLTSRMEHREECRATFFHGGLSQTTGLAHLYIANATHQSLQVLVTEDEEEEGS